MQPSDPKHDPSDSRPETGPGYEERDIDLGAILRPALVVFLVIVATFIGMRWLFLYFQFRETGREKPPVAAAVRGTRELPPLPRLQIEPPKDLAKVRREEDETLRTYGWINRDAGVVRIPIDRAMDLVAESGLPTRSERAR
jgi:hypothetical protein